MKKLNILCTVVICILLLSTVGVAASEYWNVTESKQKFTVNGQSVEANVLNVNDSNYINIKEFAKLLDIDIAYDSKTNIVAFDKNKSFSGLRLLEDVSNKREPDKDSNVINIDIPSLDGTVQVGQYHIKAGQKLQCYIYADGTAKHFFAVFSPEKDWDSAKNRAGHLGLNNYNSNNLMGACNNDKDMTLYLYLGTSDGSELTNVKGKVMINNDYVKVPEISELDAQYNLFVDAVKSGYTPFDKSIIDNRPVR